MKVIRRSRHGSIGDQRRASTYASLCDGKCEDKIKELTTGRTDDDPNTPEAQKAPSMGMKSLCIPFEQPEGLVKGETKCLNPECERLAEKFVMFGRSY